LTFLDALTEHLDAIDQRDIDRFAATLAANDVRFVGGNGAILEGRENVVEAHRAWFASDDWTFEPQILWTREQSDSGIALTRVDYSENGTSRTFLLLFIFVRENNDWKMVFDQNTPVS